MKKRLYIITIIFAFFIKVNAQDYSGYNGCALQDSLALVAFYHATDGPNWTSNQDGFSLDNLSGEVFDYYTDPNLYPNAGLGKWLEGPVKDWFGVLLEKRRIGNTPDSAWRVIHLHPRINRRDGGNNNLKGYIPKEIGMLTALEWFKVNGNIGLKNTEVPDEVYHSTLKQIDFEAVFFSGPVSEAIRNCNRIEFINIRDNFFDTLPNVDFIDLDVLNKRYVKDGGRHLFLYRNQFSWSTIEPIVDYFDSLGGDYIYEARNQNNVGRAREIVVAPGSNVTLVCNEAGTKETSYLWKKDGASKYAQRDSTYIIESVSANDTGNYTVVIKNEYIRLNDDNGDYDKSTVTKPIHLTFIPSTPVCNLSNTSYDGESVSLRFSKPMAIPTVAQAAEFSVKRNGVEVSVVDIERTGRLNDIFVVGLGESIYKGDNITISYTKGTIIDVNGGELNSFTDVSVNNFVRETPNLISAKTRKDGDGVVLGFDQYIDSKTFNPDDFSIISARDFTIEDIVLTRPEVDEDISKEITLVLDTAINITDVLSVSYNKGSLSALYGASVQSFSDFPVENAVDTNRLELEIYVIDGISGLDEVIIRGEMNVRPFSLSDEGTSGDTVAGDDTWTKTLELCSGTYKWNVYNRKTITTYDTIKSVDQETGVVTIEITPGTSYSDSLISDAALYLTVDFDKKLVTNDTIFKYRTNKVVFILDMNKYLEQNPGETIEPYVMGLDDDWLSGVEMVDRDTINPDFTYIAIVSGYNIKDVITYNFRNGDIWENATSKSRIDTLEGNDTIFVVFSAGISDVEEIASGKNGGALNIYPIPVSNDYLTVQVTDNAGIEEIYIYNLYGQKQLQFRQSSNQIDVSSVPTGVYFISVKTNTGKVYHSQFIKR